MYNFDPYNVASNIHVLLLCSRVTFEACMKDNVVEVTFSSVSQAVNLYVEPKMALLASSTHLWKPIIIQFEPKQFLVPLQSDSVELKCCFSVYVTQRFRCMKSLLGSQRVCWSFGEPLMRGGASSLFRFVSLTQKGCALDRLLLCLHLCGLERNNGVVLREHHPITSPFIQASGRKKLSEHSGSVIGTGRLDLVLGKKDI